MIFTDDEELFSTLDSLRVHGKGRDKYDNIRVGLNARLHTMQAAVLLAKLQIFPEELARKQNVAEQYTAGLNTFVPTLMPPYVPQGLRSAWAQYSILADSGALRERVQGKLKKNRVFLP